MSEPKFKKGDKVRLRADYKDITGPFTDFARSQLSAEAKAGTVFTVARCSPEWVHVQWEPIRGTAKKHPHSKHGGFYNSYSPAQFELAELNLPEELRAENARIDRKIARMRDRIVRLDKRIEYKLQLRAENDARITELELVDAEEKPTKIYIKEWDKRSGGWNISGKMDHLRGQVVTATRRSPEGHYVVNTGAEQRNWYLLPEEVVVVEGPE